MQDSVFPSLDKKTLFSFQTMQICGAGPYDQHIMLGEHELIDDSLSLAALGIFPGALLTLKVRFDLSYAIFCFDFYFSIESFIYLLYLTNDVRTLQI